MAVYRNNYFYRTRKDLMSPMFQSSGYPIWGITVFSTTGNKTFYFKKLNARKNFIARIIKKRNFVRYKTFRRTKSQY